MKLVAVFFGFLVTFSSLRGEGNPLLGEEVTMAQLEAGFRALARNHRLEPIGERASGRAMSWLDGVVGLGLTEEVENEVIHFLESGERRREFVVSPKLPEGKIRWAVQRFLELRRKPERALELFAEGKVVEFEKLGLARLYWRIGKFAEAERVLKGVQEWGNLRLEMEVINQVDSLEKYEEFLSFLETSLSPIEYRMRAYPLELDLAFQRGEWKGELKASGGRGIEWRFIALAHFGEDEVFEKEWAAFEKAGRELSVAELLVLPPTLIYDALKKVLNKGEADWNEREKVVRSLCSIPKNGDWLVEWAHFQRKQFEEDLVRTAPSVRFDAEASRVFLEILKDEMLDAPAYGQAFVHAERLGVGSSGLARELLKYVRSAPCCELKNTGASEFGGEYWHPVYTKPNWKEDELAYVLFGQSGFEDKEGLVGALRANASFANLSQLGRLKYYLIGRCNAALLEELENEEWSGDALLGAMEYLRYVRWSDKVEAMKLRAGDWASQQVIQQVGEADWLDWAERWGMVFESLRVSSGVVRQFGEVLLMEVVKVQGIDLNTVLEKVSKRAWERSVLERLTGMLRSPKLQGDYQKSLMIPSGTVRQRDLDYGVGLALLTVKPRLPAMRVAFPEDRFMSARRLEVFLPRPFGFMIHRRAKARYFANLQRGLGADWLKFEEALFRMEGLPPKGQGNFVQEHHRVSLADGDFMHMKLQGFLAQWEGDSDLEMRLAEAALLFPSQLNANQLAKLLEKYPPFYLSQVSQRAGFRVAGQVRKVMAEVAAVRRTTTREQREGAALQEAFVGVKGKQEGEAKMTGEVLEWIANHPRAETVPLIINHLSASVKPGDEDAMIKRLDDLMVERPGGRSVMTSLLKRCFILSSGKSRLLLTGKAQGDAKKYLGADPGNENILKIFIREVLQDNGDLDEIWRVCDRFVEVRGLGELGQVLGYSLGYQETEKTISKGEWREALRAYFYGKESEDFHRRPKRVFLPGVKEAIENEEEMSRYLAWLKEGGQAGFAFWGEVPERLLGKGRVAEALEWIGLAVTKSQKDAEQQLVLGLGAEYGPESLIEVVKLKEFEGFCRKVAGRLRSDLPLRLKLLLWVGSNDAQYHDEITKAIKSSLHPRASIREFDRELDQLRKSLRNHKSSAIYLVNLERALFSDPELRVSHYSWLLISALPIVERGDAVWGYWKGQRRIEGQSRSFGQQVQALFSAGLSECRPEVFEKMIGTFDPVKKGASGMAKRSQFVGNYHFVSDGNLKVLTQYWKLGHLDVKDAFFPEAPSLTYRVHRLMGLSDEDYRESQKDLPEGKWKRPSEAEVTWQQIANGKYDLLRPVIGTSLIADKLELRWTLNGFQVVNQPDWKGVFASRSGLPGLKMKAEFWFVPQVGEKRLLAEFPEIEMIGRALVEPPEEPGTVIARLFSEGNQYESEAFPVMLGRWSEMEVPSSDMVREVSEMGPLGGSPSYHLVSQILPLGQKETVIGRSAIKGRESFRLWSWLFCATDVLMRELAFLDGEGQVLKIVPWWENQARVVPFSWTASLLEVSEEEIPEGAVQVEVRVSHERGASKFTPVKMMGAK